jgi:hypothetical protein
MRRAAGEVRSQKAETRMQREEPKGKMMMEERGREAARGGTESAIIPA